MWLIHNKSNKNSHTFKIYVYFLYELTFFKDNYLINLKFLYLLIISIHKQISKIKARTRSTKLDMKTLYKYMQAEFMK